MFSLPGSGNHLVDITDREEDEKQKTLKRKQQEQHQELTECEDV